MKTVLFALLVSRCVLFATLFVVPPMPPNEATGNDRIEWKREGDRAWLFSRHRWLDAWTRNDGTLYLSIVAAGYEKPTTLSRVKEGFFPGYPYLVRPVRTVIAAMMGSDERDQDPYLLASFLVSNLLLVLGLVGLVRLGRAWFDETIAVRAGVALAVSPVSFFFSATLTESFFLATTVFAALAMERGQALRSGVFGALSCTSRVFGVVVAMPLFFRALLSKGTGAERAIRVLSVFFVPCGLMVTLLHMGMETGDPWVYFKVQAGFGHQDFPSLDGVRLLFTRKTLAWHEAPRKFCQVVAFASSVILLLSAVAKRGRRIPWPWMLWSLVLLLLPVLAGSIISLPRYVAILFPLYFVVGQWIPNRRIGLTVAALSLLLQAFCFLLFEAHYPILI